MYVIMIRIIYIIYLGFIIVEIFEKILSSIFKLESVC